MKKDLTEKRVRGIVREEIDATLKEIGVSALDSILGEQECRRLLETKIQNDRKPVAFADR